MIRRRTAAFSVAAIVAAILASGQGALSAGASTSQPLILSGRATAIYAPGGFSVATGPTQQQLVSPATPTSINAAGRTMMVCDTGRQTAIPGTSNPYADVTVGQSGMPQDPCDSADYFFTKPTLVDEGVEEDVELNSVLSDGVPPWYPVPCPGQGVLIACARSDAAHVQLKVASNALVSFEAVALQANPHVTCASRAGQANGEVTLGSFEGAGVPPPDGLGIPQADEQVRAAQPRNAPIVNIPGQLTVTRGFESFRRTTNADGTFNVEEAMSPIAISFPPGSSLGSGTLYLSYAEAGVQNCSASSGPAPAAEASAVRFEGVSVPGGPAPVGPLSGDMGVCGTGLVSVSTPQGSGLACRSSMEVPIGGTPPVAAVTAGANDEGVVVPDPSCSTSCSITAMSDVSSLSLTVLGMPVLTARTLASSASAVCGGHTTAFSQLGQVTIAGQTVATKPTGSRMIFAPPVGRPITMYGSPTTINPTGSRIPMAMVTTNYSRYDPATRSQVSSPVAVDFPAGGPLAKVIVGRVLLGYTQATCA